MPIWLQPLTAIPTVAHRATSARDLDFPIVIPPSTNGFFRSTTRLRPWQPWTSAGAERAGAGQYVHRLSGESRLQNSCSAIMNHGVEAFSEPPEALDTGRHDSTRNAARQAARVQPRIGPRAGPPGLPVLRPGAQGPGAPFR